ncbi:MAG TPA: NADP-dependent isocitrate dehydrogenase, partial [Balneolaceae bacterium]|nr:NADP-dependent isocitrate dehydrogenase [Balneolaceae bacterium]
TLDVANTEYLQNDKSPSRKVNEHDNRGSHFYLAMYWAKALANQSKDAELAERFKVVAEKLKANEDKINEELIAAQGQPEDIEGYYWPNREIVFDRMRPSETLNEIIESV